MWEVGNCSCGTSGQCAACKQAELLHGFFCCSSKGILSSPTHGNQSERQKCHETAHALQAVAEVICWLLQLVLKQVLKFQVTYENK